MWQLDNTLAKLHTEPLAGQIDLRRPQLGLHALQIPTAGQTELSAVNLLTLGLPGSTPLEEIRDSWVRGCDLVAVYSPTTRRASQPEIYWRCLTSSGAIGLELIVSIQTGLLDDNPETRIVTRLPAGQIWWLPSKAEPYSARELQVNRGSATPVALRPVDGPGSCIVRISAQLSYVEIIHPSDYCSAEVTCDERGIALQTPLFPERLEKGVIRRGRIRGWLVSSADNLTAAQQLFREFAESELPLTT